MNKQVATLQQCEDVWAGGGRSNQYPVDPNFLWVCMNTRVMCLHEMSTFHVFNSLKMIWNNTVPEDVWIEQWKAYNVKLSKEKLHYSIVNLYNELMNRPDRTQGMNSYIARMAEHVQKWSRNKLPSR